MGILHGKTPLKIIGRFDVFSHQNLSDWRSHGGAGSSKNRVVLFLLEAVMGWQPFFII